MFKNNLERLMNKNQMGSPKLNFKYQNRQDPKNKDHLIQLKYSISEVVFLKIKFQILIAPVKILKRMIILKQINNNIILLNNSPKTP